MLLKPKMSVYFRDEDLQQIQAVCNANGIDIESVQNLSALVMQMVSKIEYPLDNQDTNSYRLSDELETAQQTIKHLMSEVENFKNSDTQTIDLQTHTDLKTKLETLQADYNLIVSQAQTMVSTDDAELKTLRAENAKLKSEIVQFSGMVHNETKTDNPAKPGNWFSDLYK